MTATISVETDPDRNSDVARLVEAAADGDAESWTELVTRFSPMIQSIARSHRLGQADAADVVQTTWVKIVENIDRIERPERVGGWLATTARRECLRVIRNAGREVLSDDTDFVGE